MTDEVTPRFKVPKEPVEKSEAQKRGLRNKRSGHRKQGLARKAIEQTFGVEAARFRSHLSNEESWSGLPMRVEVKSGAQVGPIATRFLAAEGQSAQNHAVGDPRPFVFVAMPAGMTDGFFCVRLSQLQAVLDAFGGV
jgi:hypothetical protein